MEFVPPRHHTRRPWATSDDEEDRRPEGRGGCWYHQHVTINGSIQPYDDRLTTVGFRVIRHCRSHSHQTGKTTDMSFRFERGRYCDNGYRGMRGGGWFSTLTQIGDAYEFPHGTRRRFMSFRPILRRSWTR